MTKPRRRPRKADIFAHCAWHKPDRLSYVHASLGAEERLARGEQQILCPDCQRFLWPHEWGHNPNRVLKGSK